MDACPEPSAEPKKPVVVFYDCCVPENHIKVLSIDLPFAEHIFVNKRFSRAVCSSDCNLFSKIYELRQLDYPDSLVIFVTVDQDFLNEVQDNPARSEILVIILESVSDVSFETARERIRRGLQPIFDLCPAPLIY